MIRGVFRHAGGHGFESRRPLSPDFSCKKSPVVYTCGVSVLQDLRRTKAVLGGLQSVESTQNHGSEKAGVGGSTPVT